MANRTPYFVKELILRSALVDEKTTSEIWEEVEAVGHTMSKLSVRRIVKRYEDTETQYGDITTEDDHDTLWSRLVFFKEDLPRGTKLVRRLMQDVIHQDTNVFFDFDAIDQVKAEFESFLAARLTYINAALDRKDDFTDAVFAESCFFRLEERDTTHDMCRIGFSCGQKRKFREYFRSRSEKYICRVYVWAGISARGATAIYITDQAEEKQKSYVGILREQLEPFGAELYPGGFRLIQEDNDTRSGKTVKGYIERAPYAWEKLPAESTSDLNPIYRVWVDMSGFIRKRDPRNRDDLVAGIRAFWEEQMTVERCQKYVEGMKKNLSMAIRKEGLEVYPWDFTSYMNYLR